MITKEQAIALGKGTLHAEMFHLADECPANPSLGELTAENKDLSPILT